MIIKAIAWDIDGTLINSEPLHLRAFHHVSDVYNVDVSDFSDDHFVGVNVKGVWDEIKHRYPSNLSFDKWLQICNEFYYDNVSSIEPMPNAVKTVQALDKIGIIQVAVSNSNRPIVDANLKRLGINDILKFSLSLDDVPKPKPDPSPYLMAAIRLGLTPREMLAIEDSPAGALSGYQAGMTVIGLRDTHQSLPHATLMVKQLLDIPKWLER